LPSLGQPVTLRIPKNGRLVEWSPQPAPVGVADLALASESSGPE